MTQDEINKLWLVGEHDPILQQPTRKVEDFSQIQALAKYMVHVMEKTGGVGLSANQVGVDWSMFVMRWPPSDADPGGDRIIVNPSIVDAAGKEVLYEEGCLSFPGLYFWLSRPATVQVTYQNEKAEEIQEEFSGWPARIFQHEYDHMQGKTFKSRASKLKLDRAEKKRNKMIRTLVQNR